MKRPGKFMTKSKWTFSHRAYLSLTTYICSSKCLSSSHIMRIKQDRVSSKLKIKEMIHRLNNTTGSTNCSCQASFFQNQNCHQLSRFSRISNLLIQKDPLGLRMQPGQIHPKACLNKEQPVVLIKSSTKSLTR